MSHVASEILRMQFVESSEALELTPTHKLRSADNEDWIPAADLLPGSRVRAGDGYLTVSGAGDVEPNRQVFNIEVDRQHAYRVLNAEIWAHNTDCPTAARPHQHHVFPQEFRKWFKKQGIEIDKYLVDLPPDVHLDQLHARNINTNVGPMNFNPGGIWNENWRQFIDAHPNGASPQEIREFGQFLCKGFGIQGCP